MSKFRVMYSIEVSTEVECRNIDEAVKEAEFKVSVTDGAIRVIEGDGTSTRRWYKVDGLVDDGPVVVENAGEWRVV